MNSAKRPCFVLPCVLTGSPHSMHMDNKNPWAERPETKSQKLKVSLSTLSRWRKNGSPHNWLEVSGAILYPNEVVSEGYAVREDTLAEKLQVSSRTLARWRDKGTGPAYLKDGRLIIYPIEAIKEWLATARP